MAANNQYLKLKQEIVKKIKTVFDPEIPVNVYDLGLIYKVDIDANNNVKVEMTLTAPNCPIADQLVDNVKKAIKSAKGVKSVQMELVFEPAWSPELMSDEAKLELGLL